MRKRLITNLNHKNSFVRGPLLVFIWVYPNKFFFYIYISGFFHKQTCPSKYRALAGGPPRPPPRPAMLVAMVQCSHNGLL
ncbi:hypothetical protein HanPI659440_Chr13g0510341 [Helianthus annuus]|nr:hypothetical protein HanPI659440_Chr13g0510341 [Helianthus annuus]